MYLTTLPSIDLCSIYDKTMSIFSALLTINSLYGLISPLVLSNLLSFQFCSIYCFRVLVLIMSHGSTFLYMSLACSSIRYSLSLFSYLLSGVICPPIFVFKGKNVVGSFLSFTTLNVPA